MQNVYGFFDTKKASGMVIAVLFSVLFVALITYGATTISTNVNTGGTLTVSGASTIASLTASGAVAASGTVQVTGAFTSYGNVTLGDAGGDVITITGNASTTNSLTVNKDLYVEGTASTTNLRVGGNDGANGLIAGVLFGTCNLQGTGTHAASTTRGYVCSGATGVTTSHKIFVQATSTFVGGASFTTQGASSTGANTIGVDVVNWGFNPTNVIGNATLNFFGIK